MLRDYERTLKAAADPTRARILAMLGEGEMCVCQLIAVLGLSQSTVSKHLSLLKEAGLVRERKDRKFVHYSLQGSSASPAARALLANLAGWVGDDPVVARDRERARMAKETVRSMGKVLARAGKGRKR